MRLFLNWSINNLDEMRINNMTIENLTNCKYFDVAKAFGCAGRAHQEESRNIDNKHPSNATFRKSAAGENYYQNCES